MGKAKRKCVICGKEYTTCFPYGEKDPFRWQDVACCPEHGSMYFESAFGSYYTDTLKNNEDKPADINEDVKEDAANELPDETYEYDDESNEYDDDDIDDDDYDE